MDKISIATNIDICTREEQIILCNQYEDNTRQIVCNIQKDGVDFNVPSDMSVYIRVYKTLSGCGVYKKIGENNFGSVSENIVTIPITKEMTISYGKQECNLEFRNADDDVLYTSNFILRVTKSALQNEDMKDRDDYATVFSKAEEASASALSAANSATSALESMNTASTKANEASSSASDCLELKEVCLELKEASELAQNSALSSEQSAQGYATSASSSKTDAQEYAEESLSHMTDASTYASNAQTSATNASNSETNTSTYKDTTYGYLQQTIEYASSASSSSSTSTEKAELSQEYANASSVSAASAQTSATNASTSATNASASAILASEKATEIEATATLSESYAKGGTSSREGEDIDNSKYYMLQAQRLAEGFSGALIPMGTIVFANLPTEATVGYMYNISDQFVTDERFKEGAGNTIPAGTNVYYTADYYWDCLAGSPVTGVKGENETDYRRGNVNITKGNIGLNNVDNTSDQNKPISTLQQEAFDNINNDISLNLANPQTFVDAGFTKNGDNYSIDNAANANNKVIYDFGEDGYNGKVSISYDIIHTGESKGVTIQIIDTWNYYQVCPDTVVGELEHLSNTFEPYQCPFSRIVFASYGQQPSTISNVMINFGDKIDYIPYVGNKINQALSNVYTSIEEVIEQKGANNGIAELDSDGKVPIAQIPSSELLGETSSTAYRGDRGKTAYDHSQNTTVHITSDERSTWNNKSDFSGSYNDLSNVPNPTRTNTTSWSTPGYAGTFTVVDNVTSNSEGHITKVNTKTVRMPAVPSKSDIGLGNVKNLGQSDQVVDYVESTQLSNMNSGETMATAFGKIKKAITTLISHVSDTVKHITSGERTLWNTVSSKAPLNGSGANGTWGINITGSSGSCTGNSATATKASGVVDYGGSATIQIGFSGAGLTSSTATHLAAYTDGGTKIKGLNFDEAKCKMNLTNNNIVNLIYPVGSIYMSVNSTSPSALFGGTWSQIKDTFLLSAGSTYSANSTGGSATKSYTPSGTVGNHTLTVSEIPSHTHNQNEAYGNIAGSVNLAPGNGYYYNKVPTSGSTGGGAAHNHPFTGTSASINVMPPYLTVYMWKRTA